MNTAENVHMDELRDRVVGHIRDDPETHAAVEELADRNTEGDGDAWARVLLALADGEQPDADDLSAVLTPTEGGDKARLLESPGTALTAKRVWFYGRVTMARAGIDPPASTDLAVPGGAQP